MSSKSWAYAQIHIVVALLVFLFVVPFSGENASAAPRPLRHDADEQMPKCINSALYLSQSPYPTVFVEQPYELWFELKNTGTCTWRAAEGYHLLNTSSAGIIDTATITATKDIQPGESYRWRLPLVAPARPGIYYPAWQVAYHEHTFGSDLWIRVSVVPRRDNDNRPASANELVIGDSQVYHLTPAGDEDWFRFDLSARSGITVQTTGKNGDTQLWLYDEQAQQELAYNDDANGSYFSRIEIDCGAKALLPGRYLIKVAAYDPTQEIPRYTIHLAAQDCPALGSTPGPTSPIATPTSPLTTRYQVSESAPVCGGIIALQVIPSADSRTINFRMTKCDNTPIRLNGNLSIVVDGIYSVGPYRYYAGEMAVDAWIDPLGALGLSGQHRYEAYVYPDGQSYPIISGVVLAWDVGE